jgi:hypothetical protein
MESETVMHWDLIRRGHRLLIEPARHTTQLRNCRVASLFVSTSDVGCLVGRRNGHFEAADRRGAPLIPGTDCGASKLLIGGGRVGCCSS